MNEDFQERIRELELSQAKMTESMLDLRERIDTHKDYCPMPEHKENINKVIKESNERFNRVIGIIVAVFFVYFSALSYLQLNKVNNSEFKMFVSEAKQEEVRRDERVQLLTQQQQQLQIKLIEEMTLIKIEITKMSAFLGKK